MTGDERRIAERRTMALRGPGAGGFTPAHSQAASNPCLNCGTNVQLDFCPECGQRTIDADPTLREYLHELAEEFLHWDGKLLTTFRMLVTRPGALTVEYLAGRRVRYVSPMRVYLTCSVLFFFAGALARRPAAPAAAQAGVDGRAAALPAGARDSIAAIAAADRLAAHGRVAGRLLGEGLRNRTAIGTRMFAMIPQVMFVVVPLAAGFVALIYRRSRRRYPQHLAYALHVHAFVFLAMTANLARHLSPSQLVRNTIGVATFVVICGYLVQSSRAVYDGSLAGATLRSALVLAGYGIVFVAAVVVTAVSILTLHL